MDPPLILRFLTFPGNHLSTAPPPADGFGSSLTPPGRLCPGQPGTGSCVPPSAAHEIRVYVYPAAEELKHAWTAATLLLAEAPVKMPRARAARARPHNLFVLLLVLFVVSRSQIVHNLYFSEICEKQFDIYFSDIWNPYKKIENFGIYLFEICNYPQITSLCPINYTEVIIVNIVIRRCKYSYKIV